MEKWKMTITFEGNTFESLKFGIPTILKQVVAAKTYKDLPMFSGIGGLSGSSFYYSIEHVCPVQLRIANLRAEADALEASLGN